MAAVTEEILIEVPVERFYDVIVDYARYPEFVPGIKACRPREERAGIREVEYELDLGIKRIRYLLRHEELRPSRVAWSLVSGELMKVSNGSWELAPEGSRTRARYSVEVHLSKPPLVPQSVIDRVSDELTRVQLPRTLHAFKRRAEEG
ncbi:type II toxin-antitoxin system RatA family toxin [Anaeromyxobacter oryzae]|uniref:Coenzyme Q-binding protein COQ10 START domain-containing protein n=1 Tax=Anaeromyxobacter oryzae TaxID=2918170 RepID=A0ABM7X3Z5_9BACT|nr:SRPBCC family protein [Anaeromyxobacter oryzae]BDG06499.1 hypothetical protein AMOR_54950 [Anaeromyxobacter oryzae]